MHHPPVPDLRTRADVVFVGAKVAATPLHDRGGPPVNGRAGMAPQVPCFPHGLPKRFLPATQAPSQPPGGPSSLVVFTVGWLQKLGCCHAGKNYFTVRS